MNGAWTVADLGIRFDEPSPVVVPWRWWKALDLCSSHSPDRYRCTRREGHGLRHAAINSDGEVYAVWPEPEPTA